jgi:hypothetical protein
MAGGTAPPVIPRDPPFVPENSAGLSTAGRPLGRLLGLALAPLLLSGCFEAEADLISSHRLTPVSLESLITLNGYPYRLDRVKGNTFGCELRRKSDNAARCGERYRLTFERTAGGNLIVQAAAVDAKFLDDDKAVFLLIARAANGDYKCFYLLGATDEDSSEPVKQAEQAIADRFGGTWINRKDLLEIVDAYERTVLPLNEGCPGARVVVTEPGALRFADEPPPYRPAP